jgi:hypothetical protein
MLECLSKHQAGYNGEICEPSPCLGILIVLDCVCNSIICLDFKIIEFYIMRPTKILSLKCRYCIAVLRVFLTEFRKYS